MITTAPQPDALEHHPASITYTERALLWLAHESSGAIYVLNPTLPLLDVLVQNITGREIVAVDPEGLLEEEAPLGVHLIRARIGDFQETFRVGLVIVDGCENLRALEVQAQAAALIQGLTHAGQEDVIVAWSRVDARGINGTFQAVDSLTLRARHLAGTTVAFTVWQPRHKRGLLL